MYGNTYNDNSGFANAGINKGTNPQLVFNPNGGSGGSARNVFDFSIEVVGLNINKRIFTVDENNLQLREKKNSMTGVMEKEPIEAAKKRAYGNFNSEIRSIVTGMGISEDTYTEAMKSVTDFETFKKALGTLIAKVDPNGEFECILSFDANGYLKLPKYLWTTGRYLRPVGSDLKLEVSDKIVMVKPGEEEKPKEEIKTEW